MTNKLRRLLEIVCLTTLVLLSLMVFCWGPGPLPLDPPSTPVVNPFMSMVTIAAMAAYGFWKIRK